MRLKGNGGGREKEAPWSLCVLPVLVSAVLWCWVCRVVLLRAEGGWDEHGGLSCFMRLWRSVAVAGCRRGVV